MRNIWFIGSNDLRYTIRERETLLWLFIMPVGFFYFIGTVTSGFGGGNDGSSKDRLSVRVPDNSGFLADSVLKRLDDAGFEVVHPETEEAFSSSYRRLVIPEGFTESALAGTPAKVRFERKELGLSQQYDELRIRRAAYTVLADLVACAATGQTPTPEAVRALAAMPRTLSIEVQAGGKRQHIPTGFEQAIPGTMVMFTLLVLLTSGAVSDVVDRRLGVLRRLAATPISRLEIVLGKLCARLALALVQIVFAMIAGSVLFGMRWGLDLPMVLLVMLGWASFCAALALLVGNLCKTEGQAVAAGVLSSNVLAALGGCWWPIEITPSWMQTISKFLPTGWTMDAMHKLVSFQAGPASVLPHTLALFASALAIAWLASRRFQFQ